jgi:hypothetical protein
MKNDDLEKIKVGMLVSYDYELLKNSIPRLYKDADSISLAIDYKLRTWSGNTIEIPASFFEWIKAFDIENKIVIYKDDFYDSKLTVKENDTRERNMLGEFMGEGGWHIQVDSDEYFLDFKSFCDDLRGLNIDKPVSICPRFFTLFKKLEDSFLYISGEKNHYPVATNFPAYDSYRSNLSIKKINLEHLVVHDSWGRSSSDLLLKLKNWSHKSDFDVMGYFKLWEAINKTNYKCVNYFHPISFNEWRHLKEIKADNIEELINNLYLDKIDIEFENDIILAAKQPLVAIVIEKIKQKWFNKG